MATFVQVDASVLDTVKRGRKPSAATLELVDAVRSLASDTAIALDLADGEKPMSVRAAIVRAAKIADVKVRIVRTDTGWAFGLAS